MVSTHRKWETSLQHYNLAALQPHNMCMSALQGSRLIFDLCSLTALQAAQLQSLRNSQQMPYISSTPNVLLELMLLCAQAPGAAYDPLDASTQQLYQQAAEAAGFDSSILLDNSSGSETLGGQGAGGIDAAAINADAAADEAGSQGDVELLVLVSGMRNMPLVPG